MARVVITRRAAAQLEAAFRYIAADSPFYAKAWRTRMKAAIRLLGQQPLRGYPALFYPQQNLRILRRGTYKIVYRVSQGDTLVEVILVLHQAQLPPDIDA